MPLRQAPARQPILSRRRAAGTGRVEVATDPAEQVLDAQHTPVMVEEVLDGMAVRSSGAYIDCTVGAGGHSLAILGAAPA